MKARIVALFAAALLVGACRCAADGSDDAMCMKRKPGTITTVNQYCVMVQNDPVDPSVVVEWKGQKVGFCCKGCLPKWDKLTDAQKDAALASAVAKGPIKD